MSTLGAAPGASTLKSALAFAYLDRWTARPGERTSLHVSSESDFEARVVRIVQADDGALGPGRKEEQQDWYAPSAHEALVQPVRPGSRAVSGPLARLAGATSVALEVIFRPSLIDDHGDRLVAGLAARDGRCALAIGVGPGGHPELLVGTELVGGGEAHHEAPAPTSQPLRAGRWYRARAVMDLEEAAASLTVTSAEPDPSGDYRVELGVELSAAALVHLHGTGAPHHLVLAAWEGAGERAGPFNGKLEAPVVSVGAATADVGRVFIYAWRLGEGARASELYDASIARAPLRPVYRNEERDFYAVARFQDVAANLRDWQCFSSSAGVRPDDLLELQGPSIIAMGPPRHHELRQIVQPAFFPKEVARLEPLVEKKANALLADLAGGDEIGIVPAFVKRLPVLVVCELMGLPEADAEMLKDWADETASTSAADGSTSVSARGAAKNLRDYFAGQLADRRRRPGDDLISRLAAAGPGPQDEVVGMCNLLFEAGNSTTSGLIGNSLVALAEHPGQRAWAIEHPAAWPGAIEELLRYDAPVQNLSRVLTEPVSVQGIPIPAGATVVLVLGAADRDPREWDAPNDLRLMREPRRNLAFGAGIHHCIGAPLARLEGRIGLRLLLAQMPEYKIVTAERAHDINLHMYKSVVLEPTPLALTK